MITRRSFLTPPGNLWHDWRRTEFTSSDDIFRSDFTRSFMQFQHHNITSDKLSDQNYERFYHVKQTVENRKPSKMGDVATAEIA
jgi:hypothetical protein